MITKGQLKLYLKLHRVHSQRDDTKDDLMEAYRNVQSSIIAGRIPERAAIYDVTTATEATPEAEASPSPESLAVM